MKVKLLYPFALLLLLGSFNCNNNKPTINDDFLQDLSSEDNRIWGELYLDVFNENFNKLTFNYYISYLDSTQHTAAEGIVDKINEADLKLLKTQKKTFWVLLYYKNQNLIIADDASTDIGTVDTSIIYTDKTTLPNLEYYAEKIIKY